jgi:hypothetical protein
VGVAAVAAGQAGGALAVVKVPQRLRPACPGMAAAAVARGGQPGGDDSQRDLPGHRPAGRPVRHRGVPAPVPAPLQHTWLDRGGAEGDLTELNGWTSPQMLRRYGASARSARARRSYDRIMTDRP